MFLGRVKNGRPVHQVELDFKVLVGAFFVAFTTELIWGGSRIFLFRPLLVSNWCRERALILLLVRLEFRRCVHFAVNGGSVLVPTFSEALKDLVLTRVYPRR